jgi:hypothetical protein
MFASGCFEEEINGLRDSKNRESNPKEGTQSQFVLLLYLAGCYHCLLVQICRESTCPGLHTVVGVSRSRTTT